MLTTYLPNASVSLFNFCNIKKKESLWIITKQTYIITIRWSKIPTFGIKIRFSFHIGRLNGNYHKFAFEPNSNSALFSTIPINSYNKHWSITVGYWLSDVYHGKLKNIFTPSLHLFTVDDRIRNLTKKYLSYFCI